MDLDDGIGIFGGDLFDLHTAGSRCHENVAAHLAIEHDAEIQLARNGQRFFNQQALHFLAFRAGLVCDQIHAQHLGNQRCGLFRGHGDLHTAALAASARMNLRFDDNACGPFAQQCPGRAFGFLARFDLIATRNSHSILRKNGLSLIFVYFHDFDYDSTGRLTRVSGLWDRSVCSLQGWRNSRKLLIV